MLVVNRVRDHHVSHLRVERGSLAQDIYPRDPGAVFGDLPEDVVRGQAEGVVDVDDAGAGRAQPLLVDRPDAWVDRRRVELRDLEHLGCRVDTGPLRGYVPDAVRSLHLRTSGAQLRAVGMLVEELARPEVEPVGARSAAVAGLELAPFLSEVRVIGADEVEDVFLEMPCDPGEDVDEAVRVGRHEIDRRLTHAHLVHRGRDRLPPAAGVARVAEVAAADQPQDDPAFLAFDLGQDRVEVIAPGQAQAPPVLLARTRRQSRILVVEGNVLEQAMHLVPLDLEGDQRRRRAGALTACQLRMSAPNTARKPWGLWPMTTRRQRTMAPGRRRTA